VAAARPSSFAGGICASVGRLIFVVAPISRAADDGGGETVYVFGAMRLRLEASTVDLLVACVLTIGVELQVWLGHGTTSHQTIAALVCGVVTGSVAVRRRSPAAVGFGVQGILAVAVAVGFALPAGFLTIGWFCALYALTVWTSNRVFVAGLVFVVVSDLWHEVIEPRAGSGVPFTIGAVAVMCLVRFVLGDRDRRVRLAERERDLAAREAVVEERARIARELHDAIAHDVSLIVVQAGAERLALDGAAGSTGDVLHTIERTGRGALTEMRRLVGMLRSSDAESLAPQPSLADLPRLVSQVREAGLPVELEVEGERRELPLGIELSAYRIVQEALTNALKHAGDARATVRVRYSLDQLELEVADDGVGGPARVAGGGHGLAGMRERVALYGGRLDAGRRAERGFAVRVVLPIR
jgi:signal transduction histidine kinase